MVKIQNSKLSVEEPKVVIFHTNSIVDSHVETPSKVLHSNTQVQSDAIVVRVRRSGINNT